MKQLTFLMILLFLCSCEKNNTEVKYDASQNIDYSTPDRTVKSLLAYSTWYDTCEVNLAIQHFKSNKSDLYSFFTSEAKDTLSNKILKSYLARKESIVDRYVIDNVDIQSDSRAIVFVKTKEMTYGIYHDESLIMIKYTLTKENDKWLIELIEKTCSSCDGTGKDKDYSSYSIKWKKCKICGGDGWYDSIYGEHDSD